MVGPAGIEPATTSDYLVSSSDRNSNELMIVINSETTFIQIDIYRISRVSQGIDKI